MRRRVRIALLPVLALLGMPLQPARAGWTCPNGDACVRVGAEAFACLERLAGKPSCCAVPVHDTCDHGELPAAGSTADQAPQAKTPDHCRFRVEANPAGSPRHLDTPPGLDPGPMLPAFGGVRLAAPTGVRRLFFRTSSPGRAPPGRTAAGPRAPPSR
ncbi:MAG: hypothetical protein ACK47B_07985 [Armatimonadota bacterium]